ncbi:uncharacterized protein LOC131328394 [Rhododendron vialii]|uniref:uncharacterized protein LOC131328394 n=1 Tax=Rhododendron vialii TaxID=182163 RepID=UPI00265F8CBC|nr:uncharacterized protein LOC131328394 [Rhododendron vialii]
MKLQPPTFSGGMEPFEAEEWLKRMESIFDVMSVLDDQKVVLAPFMLKDKARFWWEATKGLLTTLAIRELEPPVPKKVTWKEFIAGFNEQYFPLLYRYDMEHEFSSLRQGNMSVAEYNAKFIKLSRFQFGLDPDIRAGVATHEAKRYSDLVHKSKIPEKSVNEKKERQAQYKRVDLRLDHIDRGFRDQSSQKQQPRQQTSVSLGSGTRDITCFSCGARGHVARDCKGKQQEKCYRCNQPEHKIRDCPVTSVFSPSVGSVAGGNTTSSKTPQRGGGSSSGPRTQARVFAMTR